jgi:hypothetical protein
VAVRGQLERPDFDIPVVRYRTAVGCHGDRQLHGSGSVERLQVRANHQVIAAGAIQIGSGRLPEA